jgi:hypothetical protein
MLLPAVAQVSLETGIVTCEVLAGSPLDAYALLPSLVEAVRGLGFEAEPHIAGLE